MLKNSPTNKLLLFNIIALMSFGFFIFLSASLGLLAKSGAKYSSIVLNQIFFGIIAGGIIVYINSIIPYKFWKMVSFWLFISAWLLTLLVFVPQIGLEVSGAKRWLLLGPISFQPSEFLKIAYVIYLAVWLSVAREKIRTFQYGTLPFIILTILSTGLLFFQPDNDTALVMLITGGIMYFVAGANLKHILPVAILIIIAFSVVLISRPYVVERLKTFIDPSADISSTGYQVDQSLIAIGSGGFFGRGFGQSLQKFDLLPEPIGDSIFAVAGEEFGFLGGIFIILLFVTLLIQTTRLSILSKDTFGGLLMLGFGILIVTQSFINIASMLGVFPLSGLPLLFISHGGTALFFTLFASGIMLNISRFNNQ
ncbi:MAG TPA: FtsW/RodA/SpoVE family cell cycle protein [Candidatus Paceibacterota bacterium]|nr:FtsW/RodA/SpoVE family cell cycle protein [Candidatus Paceibacterota bacterium]